MEYIVGSKYVRETMLEGTVDVRAIDQPLSDRNIIPRGRLEGV